LDKHARDNFAWNHRKQDYYEKPIQKILTKKEAGEVLLDLFPFILQDLPFYL